MVKFFRIFMCYDISNEINESIKLLVGNFV